MNDQPPCSIDRCTEPAAYRDGAGRGYAWCELHAAGGDAPLVPDERETVVVVATPWRDARRRTG